MTMKRLWIGGMISITRMMIRLDSQNEDNVQD
jgi:hypothetical protein